MVLKTIYIIGTIFLFLGLFWLIAPEIPFFGLHDNPDPKILLYIIPGIIPTLLGIYLIEYYNKIKNSNKSKINNNLTR